MRIRSTVTIVVCLSTQLLGQTPPARDQSRATQTAPPAGTASVTGVALITAGGQSSPIRRARVTLRADDGTTRTTDTDTSGQFRVDQLKGGTYRVVVDKSGFIPIGHDPMIDVTDGQTAKATVMMQRGAAIEGRVLSADGEPAPGLTVSAEHLGYGPYGKKPVVVRQTTTDDLGRFRLHTLAAGDYYLEAAPDPTRTASGSGSKPAKTYYAGVARLNDAQPIAVQPEQQLSNLTFKLTTAVLANITGEVTASTGKAPGAYSVRVQRAGGPSGDVRCFVVPPTEGEGPTFSCLSVPPGDYRLLVTTRATPQADIEFGFMPLTVDGRPLSNLRITTSAGVPVAGRVDVEGGAAIPANVQVVALETEYEYPGPSLTTVIPAIPPATVAPDGAFRFSSVAGPRVIRVQRLPDDWALKSVTLDGVDVSDVSTTFVATGTPVLRVVLTNRTGSVTGTVLGADGRSMRDARVVVFADDVRAWHARSLLIRTAVTGAGGRYSVNGLLPGSYRVAFVDQLEEGAWEDPDVLARLRTTSSALTIAAGTKAMLDGRIR